MGEKSFYFILKEYTMKTLKLILSVSTTVMIGASLLAASPSYGARLGTGNNHYSVGKKIRWQPRPSIPQVKPKPNSQPVPEPASVLGIMAFGALGGSRLLKRRHKGAV